MTEEVTAYINRDHQVRYQLKQRDPETGDIVVIPEDAVTRAVLKLQGPDTFCIDTDKHGDPITLLENATVLGLQLGRIEGLQLGTYRGWLTLYDPQSPNGEPWGQGGRRKDRPTFSVRVINWPICPIEED